MQLKCKCQKIGSIFASRCACIRIGKQGRIAAALRIATKHNKGVAITNFQLEHTKDKSGKTVTMNLDEHHRNYQKRVLDTCTKAGVQCQVTTVPNEDNYYSFDPKGRKPATIKFSK